MRPGYVTGGGYILGGSYITRDGYILGWIHPRGGYILVGGYITDRPLAGVALSVRRRDYYVITIWLLYDNYVITM